MSWTREENERFTRVESEIEEIKRTTTLTYAALSGIPPNGEGGILNDIKQHKEDARRRDDKIRALEDESQRKRGEEARKEWERRFLTLLWGAAGTIIVEAVLHLFVR